MYSIMPAFVSALFLVYGIYVISSKGFTSVSISFSLLCFTTFFWQATWAVLFQTHDPNTAMTLARLGYFLIIFLPTSLYLFLAEISAGSVDIQRERRYVAYSYAVAIVLAFTDIATNLFVSGVYLYFFGYYPTAGVLHVIHVLQTTLVVSRGLYITYLAYRSSQAESKKRLGFCLLSLLIYFMAAIDYLANYGFSFYPPGIVFITVSLGIIAIAVLKYDLMNPYTLAVTIAHELRTPLAAIQLQALELSRNMALFVDRQEAKFGPTEGLEEKQKANLDRLEKLPSLIIEQIKKSNLLIKVLLASATLEKFDQKTFSFYSAQTCIQDALSLYPFSSDEKILVTVDASQAQDFRFLGSDILLCFILFNLLKNALYAIKVANKGTVHISCAETGKYHCIYFMDTASGIPLSVLKNMFDEFYSTKKHGEGTGIGLFFCKKVMQAFSGEIVCDSVVGQYTRFTLRFPKAPEART